MYELRRAGTVIIKRVNYCELQLYLVDLYWQMLFNLEIDLFVYIHFEVVVKYPSLTALSEVYNTIYKMCAGLKVSVCGMLSFTFNYYDY